MVNHSLYPAIDSGHETEKVVMGAQGHVAEFVAHGRVDEVDVGFTPMFVKFPANEEVFFLCELFAMAMPIDMGFYEDAPMMRFLLGQERAGNPFGFQLALHAQFGVEAVEVADAATAGGRLVVLSVIVFSA